MPSTKNPKLTESLVRWKTKCFEVKTTKLLLQGLLYGLPFQRRPLADTIYSSHHSLETAFLFLELLTPPNPLSTQGLLLNVNCSSRTQRLPPPKESRRRQQRGEHSFSNGDRRVAFSLKSLPKLGFGGDLRRCCEPGIDAHL